MNKYSTPLFKAYEKVIGVVANIQWTGIKARLTGGPGYNLLTSDLDLIRALIAKDYYIILTRRKTHLTTYLISFASLVKTGKISNWAHALMNMEGDDPVCDADFKLVEATGTGVHYSTFDQVFDCDWVALLKPKHVNLDDFTNRLDLMLIKETGKPYDNLFDLADDSRMSCVELVRSALKGAIPDYDQKFVEFERLIKKYGNLTPQMFADCSDFEIVLEIRR